MCACSIVLCLDPPFSSIYTHSLLHKHQQVVHDPVLASVLTSLFYGLAHQARAEVAFTARQCEEGVT